MWWFRNNVNTSEVVKSDWQAFKDHATAAFGEMNTGWGRLDGRLVSISERLLSKTLADRVNAFIHGIPWMCLGLICPTILVIPAIGCYYYARMHCGPFSEQSIKNASNGLGAACAVVALSHAVFMSQFQHLLSACIYSVASFYLLKRGGQFS